MILVLALLAAKGWSQQLAIASQAIHPETRRNAVYLEVGGNGLLGSLTYDYIIPFTNKGGLVAGVSVGFFADLVPRVNYLFGQSKHFWEAGVGYSLPVQLVVPQVAYRYQADKGFLFRATAMYFQSTSPDSFGDVPWLGLSFGYAF